MNLDKLLRVTMTGGDRMITLPHVYGAKVMGKIILQFDIETLPDLSHLIKLKKTCDWMLPTSSVQWPRYWFNSQARTGLLWQ